MLKLIIALRLLTPASAQDISAAVVLPEAGWPVGEDIVAVSDDVVVLLPPSEHRPSYLVERRGADLSATWSAEVELSQAPGQGGLYDPSADRASWTSLQASDEVVWIFYMDGLELRARAVDPATGSTSDARDVARIGSAQETRDRFASTALSGSHPHPGTVPFAASPSGRYYVVGTTGEGGEQSVRVLDEDLATVSDFALEEGGLYQVRFQVTDEGTLLMSGAERGGTDLFVIRVPSEGDATTAIVDLGDRRTVRDLRLVESEDARVYVAALSGTPGNRINALHVIAVDGAQILCNKAIDDEFLKAQLDTGLLGLGFQGLDGFVRLVQADLDPAGDLLLGLRPMFAVEGKNTSTELNRFGAKRDKASWEGLDTTLLSFDPAGALRWSAVLPTEVKTEVPFELTISARFADGSLRLVYRGQDQGHPTLALLDVSLADGSFEAPVALSPRFSAGSPFLGPMTLGGADGQWLVATRVPGAGRTADRTLLERVDLSVPTPASTDPAPDKGASSSDPDWLVGSAAGYAAAHDRRRRDAVRGALYGVAGGLIGTAAGVSVATSNSSLPAGVFTLGLFYGGAAYAAGRLGGGPSQGWWTTRDGAYQAGYIDGYTQVSRKQARRWALITGGAVALIGVAAQ